MAAPTLNNAVATTFASGSTLNATAPSSIAAGDLLLACATGSGGGQVSATGWTTLTSNAAWYLLYKYATASDVGAATFTFSQANGGTSIVVMALVKLGGSLGVTWETAATPSLATSSSCTAPSTTSTAAASGNNELLVCFYLALTAAGAITVPGGQTSAGEAHANSMSGILGYESISATGATGTRIATVAASVSNCGFAVLFKPSLLAAAGGVLGGDNNGCGRLLTVANWWNGNTAPAIGTLPGGTPPFTPGRNLPFWETDILGFGAALSVCASASGASAASVASAYGLFTVDVSGYFSGTIVAGGVAQSNVRVNVHWRPTWQPIHTVYTAADGTWATAARFRVGDPRYVITVEAPSTGTVYDDLIVDKPLPLA